MKIAILVYRLNGIGGIAKHVLMLARELAAMTHEVDVWAVEYDPACYPDLTRNLNVRSLRMPQTASSQDVYDAPAGKRMMIYLGSLWKAYTDQRALFEALPAGYDVINPHGDHVQWAAAAYKQRYGTPAVWMCNDFWVPTANRIEMRQMDALESGAKVETGALDSAKAKTGKTGTTDKLKELAKQPLVYPFDRYDRWSVSQMDSIVVLSERVKAQMRAHYGVESVVVRTGIATPDLTQNSQRHPGQTFRLLTVCALMPRRRIEDVLQALVYLKETERGTPIPLHYTIVGRTDHTPSYTDFLNAEVERLGLRGRVTFTGEVPDDLLATYFELCDAFVWAADEGQSWGMACMEAMAYGKPVLVSDANGLAEVLVDGEDALLFKARDPQALADALCRLVGNRMLRKQIAAAGQRLVREQYSWRANAEAMTRLFAEAILKGKTRPLHEEFPLEVT